MRRTAAEGKIAPMINVLRSSLILGWPLWIAAALLAGLATSPAFAAPYDGMTPATAAVSAKQILLDVNPFAPDGFYYMDPDGPVEANSALMFADMTTNGGGWTLGLLSLDAAPVASFDIGANTGTASFSTSHTRNVTNLAESRDAQIRYVISDGGGAVFDGTYTGRFSDTTPTFTTVLDVDGLNGTLDASFDFHAGGTDYDVLVYVREVVTPTPIVPAVPMFGIVGSTLLSSLLALLGVSALSMRSVSLSRVGPRSATMVLFTTCVICLSTSAAAAPRTFYVTGTIVDVEGTYAPDFVAGQTFSGTFVHDTDEANAGPGSITTPSTVPGHEFTSFFEFVVAPYGVDLSFPAIPGTFSTSPIGTSGLVGVVVNDDLPLTADDTGGLLPAGTYDWIEILGSTASGICLEPGGECEPDEISPADGEEWTLAVFGPTTWISDGSLIPDGLPDTPTTLIVGFEFDASGNEVGAIFATTSVSLAPPAVSAMGPVGLWLLAGFLAVGGLRHILAEARTARA
jgi:hypothetical protein